MAGMLYTLQSVIHALSTVIVKYPNLVAKRGVVPDSPHDKMEAKVMEYAKASSFPNFLVQI